MRPESITKAHPALDDCAAPIADQVKRLRDEGEKLLRKHGKHITEQGMSHRRFADSLCDVYAQIAVVSRTTAIFEEQGVEASGQEQFIADSSASAPRPASTAASTS